jgi:hypothetical protein
MSGADDLAVYLSRESLREMQENMNTMKKEVLLRVSIVYGLEYNDLLERYLPEKIRKIPGKRLKADSEPIKSRGSNPEVAARSAEDPPSRSASPAPRLVNKKIVIKRSTTASPASTVSSSARSTTKSSARSTVSRAKK